MINRSGDPELRGRGGEVLFLFLAVFLTAAILFLGLFDLYIVFCAAL